MNFNSEAKDSKGKTSRKNVGFSGVVKSNLMLIIKLWPVIFILAGTILTNFYVSTQQINDAKYFQEKVSITLEILYITDIAYMGAFEVIDTNGTSQIRGNPIMDEMHNILEFIAEIDYFISKFEDSDGNVEPMQESLIFNTSCDAPFIYGKGLHDACFEIAGGVNYAGVIDVSVDIYQTYNKMFTEFEESTKTPEEITQYYYHVLNVLGPKNYLQTAYLEQMYLNTKKMLTDSLNSGETLITWMIIITSIVTFCLTIAALPLVLIKVREQDNQLKGLFRLLPISIVLKNRWVKAHVIQYSGKMADTLRRIL